MTYDCLIVDDEKELAAATSEYFEMFGVSTIAAFDSAQCLEILENHEIGLILLDINLGDESGFTLCKVLREKTDIPILFISARQSDDDVLIALNIGGDDYVKKPYSLSILLAKVKVILKRYEDIQSSRVQSIADKELLVDAKAMKVFVKGQDAQLKTKEFKLFHYLYQNKNKVITKDELFERVWGDTFFSDGTLNVHIRKIREKIEENPNQPKHIKTVWGTGYIYED
ncbi:response regulator transcription factor [Konateibacter massiliensis]|uniref:response regulator transcription factor n=1 Tax=Konateibacter massiliensis TaxID=2002841 RepID=UPI000C1528BE|nr:response regulator transcription factor [Konateibacter massiliensis]